MGYEYELLRSFGEENGLGRAVELLRAEEEADPECRRHPRFKRKDDATAAYLRLRS